MSSLYPIEFIRNLKAIKDQLSLLIYSSNNEYTFQIENYQPQIKLEAIQTLDTINGFLNSLYLVTSDKVYDENSNKDQIKLLKDKFAKHLKNVFPYVPLNNSGSIPVVLATGNSYKTECLQSILVSNEYNSLGKILSTLFTLEDMKLDYNTICPDTEEYTFSFAQNARLKAEDAKRVLETSNLGKPLPIVLADDSGLISDVLTEIYTTTGKVDILVPGVISKRISETSNFYTLTNNLAFDNHNPKLYKKLRKLCEKSSIKLVGEKITDVPVHVKNSILVIELTRAILENDDKFLTACNPEDREVNTASLVSHVTALYGNTTLDTLAEMQGELDYDSEDVQESYNKILESHGYNGIFAISDGQMYNDKYRDHILRDHRTTAYISTLLSILRNMLEL